MIWNAVAHWIASTSKMVGGRVLQNLVTRPREIYVILASLNFHGSLDIIEVMNTLLCKDWCTFYLYFHNIAVSPDCMHRIQTLIVAHQVMSVHSAMK